MCVETACDHDIFFFHPASFDHFFHYIVYKPDPLPLNLLLSYHTVTPLFKKGLCRDGRMGGDLSFDGSLQTRAERCGSALSLMISMYKQPVQVACIVYVPETDDGRTLDCDACVVFRQGAVPSLQIHLACGPGV